MAAAAHKIICIVSCCLCKIPLNFERSCCKFAIIIMRSNIHISVDKDIILVIRHIEIAIPIASVRISQIHISINIQFSLVDVKRSACKPHISAYGKRVAVKIKCTSVDEDICRFNIFCQSII